MNKFHVKVSLDIFEYTPKELLKMAQLCSKKLSFLLIDIYMLR